MLTLYVYGDVPMFYQMLNSVAMVFNSNLFSNGGSVMLLGGLVALIMLGFKAMNHQRGGIQLHTFFFIMLFYWAGVNVQTSVTIEDVFTGNVTVVANIPIFIAGPAAIFSEASYAITQDIETAFSLPPPVVPGGNPTSGSYLSLGASGFMNPLRLLDSLRCTSRNVCVGKQFPFMTKNISNFELYCAIGNPSFNAHLLMTAPNTITYMTTLPGLLGLTTYFDSSAPKGVNIPCGDAAALITVFVSNLGSNTQLNNMIASNMIKDQPGSSNFTTQTSSLIGYAALQNSYNSVVSGANQQAVAQSGQDFMVNEMFLDVVNDTFHCSSNSGSQAALQTCANALAQRTALEQMKTDNAGAASLFERAMFPTMNLLLMLFFGLAPLVAVVAVMSPETTMKVFGSYILFGIWTQSWMPVAAIINYYIQLQAQQATMVLTSAQALSMVNLHDFEDAISLNIGLGSQMLAATPIITMSIISGSIFAMTKIAGDIGGRDRFDETLAAPALAKGNVVTELGGRNKYSTLNSGSQSNIGGGLRSLENQDLDTMKVNTGDINKSALQNTSSVSNSYQDKAAETLIKGWEHSTGKNSLYELGTNYYDSVSKGDSKTLDRAHSIASQFLDGVKIDSGSKKAFEGVLAAGISGGLGTGALLKLATKFASSLKKGEGKGEGEDPSKPGLGIDVYGKAEIKGSKGISLAEDRVFNQNLSNAAQNTLSFTNKNVSDTGSGSTQKQSNSFTSGLSQSDQHALNKAVSDDHSWQQAVSAAQTQSREIGTGETLSGFQYVTQVVMKDPQFESKMNGIYAGLSDNDRAYVDTQAVRLSPQLGVSTDSSPSVLRARDVAARSLAIMHSAIPSPDGGVSPSTQMENVMLQSITGQNSIVSTDAQQVGSDVVAKLKVGQELQGKVYTRTGKVPANTAGAQNLQDGSAHQATTKVSVNTTSGTVPVIDPNDYVNQDIQFNAGKQSANNLYNSNYSATSFAPEGFGLQNSPLVHQVETFTGVVQAGKNELLPPTELNPNATNPRAIPNPNPSGTLGSPTNTDSGLVNYDKPKPGDDKVNIEKPKPGETW